ncbi:CBS domain-containing protein [Nonomuraea sp. NPDC048916]|uniref:CBS domain-containing protein n=1 Tax=Nonomuraea sp. NPDC048916 TaxID=3154232 RepID=UPI0033EB34A9
MTIENMLTLALRELAKPTPNERRNAETRIAALREELQDTSERQRIADLGDLLDAEDALYDEAVAAIERGDAALAERLLRRCAALGDPSAEELLADLATEFSPESEPAEALRRPADTPGITFLAGANSPLRLAGADLVRARNLIAHGQSEDLRHLIVDSRGGSLSSPSPRGKETRKRHGKAPVAEVQRHLAKLVLYTVVQEAALERRVSSLLLECNRSILDCGADVICNTGDKVWAIDVKFSRFGGCRKDLCVPGAFVTSPFWQSLLTVLQREPRSGRLAADVLTPYPVPHVDINDYVADALDRLLAGGHEALPVGDHGTVLGTVTLADLAGQARSDGLAQRVVSVMRPPVYIQADASLDEVRDRLLDSSTGLLVALRADGTIAGYVTAETALAGHTEAPAHQRSTLLTGGDGKLILA